MDGCNREPKKIGMMDVLEMEWSGVCLKVNVTWGRDKSEKMRTYPSKCFTK